MINQIPRSFKNYVILVCRQTHRPPPTFVGFRFNDYVNFHFKFEFIYYIYVCIFLLTKEKSMATKQATNTIKFSKADLSSIATEVANILKPTPTEDTTDGDKVQYSDPYLQQLFETKAAIVKKIGTGGSNIVMVRGKNGVTEINKTKVDLNMINDEIQEWRDRKTHRKI